MSKHPQVYSAEQRRQGRAHVRALNERNALITAIGEAQDAHQLHYFSKVKIPRLPLSDEMRADLQLRVALRFSVLNEAAVGQQKPRFEIKEAV